MGKLSDRLLNIDEVADMLSISPKTIRNEISSGKFPIPYVKYGRRVLFKEKSVGKFINSLSEIEPIHSKLQRGGNLI